MQVNVWRNISYFCPIHCNLICQHAWCWNFNWVRPVVVVVAKSISKVQNCIFGNLWGILSYIKMSWLHSSLSNRMRNQKEIKFAINYFWLFNKTLINICSLRWVLNIIALLLKEPLSNSFVDNDQSNVWWLNSRRLTNVIFFIYNSFELL